jgi:phosphatidylglycerol:prolipoprotein diacylglycerol transferase
MYPYIHILGRDIATYGLCMVLGFFLAGFLALRKGKPHGLIVEDLLIIGACTLAMACLCGNLLYVFVTYPIDYILACISKGDFSFFTGGIVFYGGLIGGFFGALLGARIAKCKFALIERSVVPFIPIGHAIGRIGCVMGGCCYGREYDGIFALHYPHSLAGADPQKGYFPVQPLESIVNIGICLLLLWLEKRIKHTWNLLFSYLAMYAVSRFFLEMLRGDAIRGVWDGLSTSQYISIGLLVLSVAGLLFPRKKAAA